MRKTNETVYRCDHCNKAMVAKGFMVTHERMCKKNPKNQHMCFLYCKHLVKDQYIPSSEEEWRGGESREVTFTCKQKPGVELYSYKLERFKSKAERMKGKERMPLECDLYETEEGHSYGEDFHEGVNYTGEGLDLF